MVTGIYLGIGFEITRNLNPEKYQEVSNEHNGHVGIMEFLAEAAVIIAAYVDGLEIEWPGVWVYEVVEPAGLNFFWHHKDYTPSKLAEYVINKTNEWVKENEEPKSL